MSATRIYTKLNNFGNGIGIAHFKAEFSAANGACLNSQDPDAKKGRYVSKNGIREVGAAMLDNQISTEVAYRIAQLPTKRQSAGLQAHLAADAGQFKADYERRLKEDEPEIEPVGAKRGEIVVPTSVAIPLSLEDVAEIRRLRTEVGVATDADYIIEALRMMRLAISLGRIGYLVQARSSQSQEIVDFAVPLDRNDSVRPVKPYGDLSDG